MSKRAEERYERLDEMDRILGRRKKS